jgi:hypothetical protein
MHQPAVPHADDAHLHGDGRLHVAVELHELAIHRDAGDNGLFDSRDRKPILILPLPLADDIGARSCIRSGARGRFYNVVDLVNRLEIETRSMAIRSY